MYENYKQSYTHAQYFRKKYHSSFFGKQHQGCTVSQNYYYIERFVISKTDKFQEN